MLSDDCERCKGSGFDPEDFGYCPMTGVPEPMRCRDCEERDNEEANIKSDRWVR